MIRIGDTIVTLVNTIWYDKGNCGVIVEKDSTTGLRVQFNKPYYAGDGLWWITEHNVQKKHLVEKIEEKKNTVTIDTLDIVIDILQELKTGLK